MNLRPNRFPVVPPDVAALLADGDDAALLKIIADEREQNPDWAGGALKELYRRHVRVVYAACHRICSAYLGDESQTENLLNRTFMRVYDRAGKFDPVRAKCVGDAERITTAVRCWIIRQARWLAKDVAESTAMCGRDGDGGSEVVEQIEWEEEETLDLPDEVLAALDRLQPRERRVVLASYFFTDCETETPIPLNENIDAYFARKWGTTTAAIRQIRCRALTKLREWLVPAKSPTATTK